MVQIESLVHNVTSRNADDFQGIFTNIYHTNQLIIHASLGILAHRNWVSWLSNSDWFRIQLGLWLHFLNPPYLDSENRPGPNQESIVFQTTMLHVIFYKVGPYDRCKNRVISTL